MSSTSSSACFSCASIWSCSCKLKSRLVTPLKSPIYRERVQHLTNKRNISSKNHTSPVAEYLLVSPSTGQEDQWDSFRSNRLDLTISQVQSLRHLIHSAVVPGSQLREQNDPFLPRAVSLPLQYQIPKTG